ncbi:nuclear poly(a) polymerase [Trifolium repens]|nr:nuclear poly(a) polymerase [Trifolium repens]
MFFSFSSGGRKGSISCAMPSLEVAGYLKADQVHGPGADLDTLRIFFYTLHSILACIDEVTELQPIPETHVPVMKFKFDGISIDLLYASISCLIVPEVSGRFFIFYLVPLSNVPGWKYIELVFILLGHINGFILFLTTSFVLVTFIMHFILFLCYIVELYFVSILCYLVANFLNGCCWTTYALIHPFDIYVLVSNGIGPISGFVQLLLYMLITISGEKIMMLMLIMIQIQL